MTAMEKNIKKEVNIITKIKDILPGLIIAIMVALVSMFLGKFVPALGAASIAIFLGMFVGNVFLNQKVFQSGYKYSECDLLSYSIVLLGATLSIGTISKIGFNGVIFIILQMTITIVGAIYIGKKLGFGKNFTFLMASGNAVCGSSAIAATAPVIDAKDDEKGIAVTIVNVTGIVLMFLLPAICEFLYNNDTLHTSAMIGGILQSVGQVVASGAMVNEGVKDLSTIFKIVRIIFLVVVVFSLGHLKNKTNKEIADEEISDVKSKKIKIPWYVIGFFIMCGLFSANIISQDVSLACKEISHVLEIVALAAIGLRVNIKELIKQGKKVSLYGLFVGLLQIVSAVTLIGLLV